MAPRGLEVRDVSREFRRHGQSILALDGVSLSLKAGRTLAIIGESGAGKSTLVRILAGLDRPTSGEVLLDGSPIRVKPGLLCRVQMIFQNPGDALHPYTSVGNSIAEPLRRLPRRQRREEVADLLRRVGLDPRRATQRARRFSGGQQQRIVLARALAAQPSLLLCDEPTSALDVSVQAQIINLLLDVQEKQGFACIVVTHDLGVARVLAHDILVLRNGQVVENRPADEFFLSPDHPYSRQLLAASTPSHASSPDPAPRASIEQSDR